MEFAIKKIYHFFLSHYCNMNFENISFQVFNLGTVILNQFKIGCIAENFDFEN
jgi:hypothetical protein